MIVTRECVRTYCARHRPGTTNIPSHCAGLGQETARTASCKQRTRRVGIHRVTRSLVTGALMIGVALVGAGKAEAGAPYANGTVNLSDGRSTLGGGGISEMGTRVAVWDRAYDGRSVRVNFVLKDAGRGNLAVADGPSRNVQTRLVTTRQNPIVSYQVCAGDDGDGKQLCTKMTS